MMDEKMDIPDMTSEIERGIVQESKDDIIGLWSILWEVKHHMPDISQSAAKTTTLKIVRRLIEERGLVAGRPERGGRSFIRWNLSTEETLKRIEHEWEELGREPNIGEIVWFVMPE
jgi:hypothetical protein